MSTLCEHKPTGYITNELPPLTGPRHASHVVCDRPDCREAVAAWVERKTGEAGSYYKFGGTGEETHDAMEAFS